MGTEPEKFFLTYSNMGIYNWRMARASTTSDVFNAIAEPRRRAIIDCLGDAERGVNEISATLKLDQPSVSKHLRVLKEVSLVTMRRNGRERLYSVDAKALKPVHDWADSYRALWDHQIDKIKEHAEKIARLDRKNS